MASQIDHHQSDRRRRRRAFPLASGTPGSAQIIHSGAAIIAGGPHSIAAQIGGSARGYL